MFFKINWKTHIRCMAFSLIAITLAVNPLKTIFLEYFPKQINISMVRSIVNNFYIYILAIIAATSILHMLLHGLIHTIFGGNIAYGFKIIYKFIKDDKNTPISRTKLLIVLLCPLVVISILTLFITGWIGKSVFYINIIGSTSDIYTAVLLCRFNHQSSFVTRYNGYDVIK